MILLTCTSERWNHFHEGKQIDCDILQQQVREKRTKIVETYVSKKSIRKSFNKRVQFQLGLIANDPDSQIYFYSTRLSLTVFPVNFEKYSLPWDDALPWRQQRMLVQNRVRFKRRRHSKDHFSFGVRMQKLTYHMETLFIWLHKFTMSYVAVNSTILTGCGTG